MKIIESKPLRRTQIADHDGLHFINNERYTVKSGYQGKNATREWSFGLYIEGFC